MIRNALCLTVMVLSASACLAASDSHGAWLLKVPQKDSARPNPLAQDDSAVAAGALLYAQHCASCHGAVGQGLGRRPSLRTTRVQAASDGELQWLLRNGSLAHGMPSWSGLPEIRRWQVVRYLHSLPTDGPPK